MIVQDEAAPPLFEDPESLIDQLAGVEFQAAFGRAVHSLQPLAPPQSAAVGALIWDLLAAAKFAPNGVRLADRQEIVHPRSVTVRGKSFIDPELLVEGLQHHQTFNMIGVEKYRPDLRTIANGLEELFNAPVSANLYVSYEGSRGGYGPHRDQHDVLVVHLYGKKRWSIYPPASPHVPIRKGQVEEHELRAQPVEVMMTGGSCLYVPAGFAHDVVSYDGCCVHLTFGIQCPRWYDVLYDILTDSTDEMLFERIPIEEEDILDAFRTRLAPKFGEVFSDEKIVRMSRRYRFFGSLLKRRSRVIRSILNPRSDTER